MNSYPFEDRLRRGPYYTVVELAVGRGVPNVIDYVIEASEMQCTTCDKHEPQAIRTMKTLYP